MTLRYFTAAVIASILLAALYVALWWRAYRGSSWPETARTAERCGDQTWLPYEDDDGFGYREWWCHLERGHSGKHSGWLDDRRVSGEMAAAT